MSVTYDFFSDLSKTINSGQSHSVILTGNINDLFYNSKEYVPLVDFLDSKYNVGGLTKIIYEVNGNLRHDPDLETAWLKIMEKSGTSQETDNNKKEFINNIFQCKENATFALEFLRLLSLKIKSKKLVIIIEGADLLLPDCPIASLSAADRKRISIVQDWFSDPVFTNGDNSVILISESKSQIHQRIAKLPQLISIEIPSPDLGSRRHFVNDYQEKKKVNFPDEVFTMTAGLSLQAVRQLLCDISYRDKFEIDSIIKKVEEFIQHQLGEDVVEFKRPTHTLKDVVGFSELKKFIKSELIPRFRATDDSCLSGAAVAGPIGGGKTFIFEAVAAELGIPVLVLKNIRSQWYGQTDVIFERLKRVLEALGKVLLFIDEADTQFGQIGENTHETERRLTGKFQQMMSDPSLKKKVIWLLMTARIWMLSPDIRRPGRVGDLIIPVLDPECPEDIKEFIEWTLIHDKYKGNNRNLAESSLKEKKLSAAGFASLRSRIKAQNPESYDEIIEIIKDTLSPDIEEVREYQKLQSLVNCTRLSLIPHVWAKDSKTFWLKKIKMLEEELGTKI